MLGLHNQICKLRIESFQWIEINTYIVYFRAVETESSCRCTTVLSLNLRKVPVSIETYQLWNMQQTIQKQIQQVR